MVNIRTTYSSIKNLWLLLRQIIYEITVIVPIRSNSIPSRAFVGWSMWRSISMLPLFRYWFSIFMYVMTIFLSFIRSSDVLWQKPKWDISIKRKKQNLIIPKYSLILKTALIHGLNTFLGITLSGFTSDKSLRPTRIHKMYVIA